MMGDWNARAGTLSGIDISDGGSRESMDTMLDKEGIDMIELMEEFGFGVLNGRTKGDWTCQNQHVELNIDIQRINTVEEAKWISQTTVL